MEIKQHITTVFGQECKLDLMHFDARDGKDWKKIFDLWKSLKLGLRKYKAREPNFPEGLSEVAFCLWSGASRYIKIRGTKKGVAGSFDTFDVGAKRAQQIKACSVEKDLTSFGPKSKWDDVYFLDFYRGGSVDGMFDVYLIPEKYIKDQSVNKTQKFADQQSQGRRPRFSIKSEIIEKNKLKPLATSVRVW